MWLVFVVVVGVCGSAEVAVFGVWVSLVVAAVADVGCVSVLGCDV